MKVLITGGTGFIGSRLALRCLANGDEVRVLGRPDPRPAEEENAQEVAGAGAVLVTAAVTDAHRIRQAVEGCSVVFHLAAAQHEMNVPDRVFRDVNVEGTRTVAEAAAACGVSRFVHGSTIGVYGQGSSEVIDEESVLAPDNIYGVTKAEGEQVIRSLADRLDSVILRIPETYGPGDRRLVKLFGAIRKGAFFLIGPGRNPHHVLFVEDLVGAMLLAAQRPHAVGRTVLVAGPDAPTTREMAETIAGIVGRPLPRWRAPLPLLMSVATLMEWALRPLGIQPPLHRRRMDFFRKEFRFNTARQKELLGFNPRVIFSEGAERTYRWYQSKGLVD
jgi:nucleoside-diphosphate-sugar epimerase